MPQRPNNKMFNGNSDNKQFSLRLANGKEKFFDTAHEMWVWYNRDKYKNKKRDNKKNKSNKKNSKE